MITRAHESAWGIYVAGRWSVREYATLAVVAQFLALIRILSEPFRIRHFAPDAYTLGTIEPFIGAALFTSVLLAASVSASALGRRRIALGTALVNVAMLFVDKVAFM
jgi:hypothetical protein